MAEGGSREKLGIYSALSGTNTEWTFPIQRNRHEQIIWTITRTQSILQTQKDQGNSIVEKAEEEHAKVLWPPKRIDTNAE